MVGRVGIPRGLLYYKYYPLWRRFFSELGCEVILSRETDRKILKEGMRHSVDEVCLPMKVYLGHVLSLRDSVDAIFVPRMASVRKKEFICCKFMGVPDIVRNCLPGLPPVLTVDVDANRQPLRRSLYELGRQLGAPAGRIRRAYSVACLAQAEFEKQVVTVGRPQEVLGLLTGEEVDSSAFPSDLKIGLIGHVYNLYDRYTSLDLIGRIEKMGAEVITPNMIPADLLREEAERITSELYWTFGQEILGASAYLAEGRVDGIIQFVSFGCGPDSLVAELALRRLKEKVPMMLLVFDEESGEAGLLTRLESFVDMIRRQKKVKMKQDKRPPSRPTEPPPRKARPRVSFPHMGNYHLAFKTLFENLDCDVVVPPAISRRTLELGTRHSPEFVCLPFKINLGNYIEGLEQGGDVLMQGGRRGPCRYGFYADVQDKILRDLGYEFQMLKLFRGGKELNFVAALKRLNPHLRTLQIIKAARFALGKMKIIDWAEEEGRRLRAYERNKGDTNKALEEILTWIDGAKSIRESKRVRKEAKQRLEGIERDDSRRPLRIGIVGELYVVMEPFVNLDMERKLGAMGVEILRPLCLSEMLRHAVFRGERDRITRQGKDFIQYELGAHAGHSVGHTVEFAREGFDGVIQLYPFTCMPELSARAILGKVSRDMDIPILHFSLGEQTGRAGMETRLEAFVDMLERRRGQSASRRRAH